MEMAGIVPTENSLNTGIFPAKKYPTKDKKEK